MTEHAVENTEFTSAKKKYTFWSQVKTMLVCFFDHGIVHYEFIAQGQNGKSAVLFGSADKVTGTCFEEKTWTLAW